MPLVDSQLEDFQQGRCRKSSTCTGRRRISPLCPRVFFLRDGFSADGVIDGEARAGGGTRRAERCSILLGRSCILWTRKSNDGSMKWGDMFESCGMQEIARDQVGCRKWSTWRTRFSFNAHQQHQQYYQSTHAKDTLQLPQWSLAYGSESHQSSNRSSMLINFSRDSRKVPEMEMQRNATPSARLRISSKLQVNSVRTLEHSSNPGVYCRWDRSRFEPREMVF